MMDWETEDVTLVGALIAFAIILGIQIAGKFVLDVCRDFLAADIAGKIGFAIMLGLGVWFWTRIFSMPRVIPF